MGSDREEEPREGRNLKYIDFRGNETESGYLAPIIKNPFRLLVGGPSKSGKSHFTFELIQNQHLFSSPFHCISFHYGQQQQQKFDAVKKLIPNIEFYPGLPENIKKHGDNCCLIILDDLINASADSESILELFIKKSHHLGKSIILLTQNVFF